MANTGVDLTKEKSELTDEIRDVDRQGQYAQVNASLANKVADNVQDFMSLVAEADRANERERGMTLKQAFSIYPKAIGWSIVLSSCLIMEGYDTSVMGSYAGYPSFMNKFGVVAPDGTRQIPPDWQNGISGGRNAGEILGLQLAGILSDRFGYRWTIITALVFLTGLIFIPFYAETLTSFLVGNILMGIPWGIFQTMTVAYAAEVCPVPLRHYLTCFVNLCWIIGQFIKGGILVGFESRQDAWGYRIPFAIQWIWPIPLTIGIYLAPESPWWYIRRGQKVEAERSLKRLARASGFSQREADATMALMLYTDEMEKQAESGTRYWDCFKGANLRRTEIVCMTWLAQTMSGTALGGLSAYFYQQAGISASDSFKLAWGQSAVGAVGTIASWFVLMKVGRKKVMFTGMCVIFLLLIITGCMGIPEHRSTAQSWAAGSMVMLISFTADFSIGPVVYTIVSEVPSSRLRAKSIILARNAYNAINVAFVNVVAFRQLSPLAWNWGPKAAFFWAGSNALFSVYIFFRMPETKGRTYAELDILFENKIAARQFAKTRIETLVEGTEGAQKEQADRIVHDGTA
ncbi:general alpha-glucoside permease [Pleomassaria siparia CBS 279.74]|uniref:General alpha-glucoside permease n=1 Tax=Pleomassaria siparia CBS 279.74 TaxID=1314801 RepID=A0A6G1KJ83_9PLEO|nr:general alpha-glucoside permease [Pleomassaria siparia CBS 279.74]